MNSRYLFLKLLFTSLVLWVNQISYETVDPLYSTSFIHKIIPYSTEIFNLSLYHLDHIPLHTDWNLYRIIDLSHCLMLMKLNNIRCAFPTIQAVDIRYMLSISYHLSPRGAGEIFHNFEIKADPPDNNFGAASKAPRSPIMGFLLFWKT